MRTTAELEPSDDISRLIKRVFLFFKLDASGGFSPIQRNSVEGFEKPMTYAPQYIIFRCVFQFAISIFHVKLNNDIDILLSRSDSLPV
jgi:hypothetical protein